MAYALLLVGSIEVGSDVVLELGHKERLALFAAALVSDGVLDLDFVKDCAVVELDQECVTDRTLFGVVVLDAELGVFDTVDLGTECVDAGVGS